jgi:phosphoglycerol transferase
MQQADSSAGPTLEHSPEAAKEFWGGERGLHPAVLYAIQAAVTAVALFLTLHLGTKDLSVPFEFGGDTLQTAVIAKTIVDHGWWWHNANLSAPYTLPLVAFPANANVDFLSVWLVSRFTSNPGLALNLAWLLTFFYIGAIAHACLKILHVHPLAAMAVGAAYAFLPFIFYRQLAHFALSYYLVPIPCTLALLIATGHVREVSRKVLYLLLGGCALLGFNHVYNSFFSCFTLLFAGAYGYFQTRDRAVARLAGIAVALICICSALNLAPSFAAWSAQGRPAIDYKDVAQADVYGLRIRHLISPIWEHGFPPFAAWNRREHELLPIENESHIARLGVAGALGFLALLAFALFPSLAGKNSDGKLRAAAHLNLACVLLATVGGFGTLFNFFVTPDIRCYNRISVFIGFLALVAVAQFLTGLRSRIGSRPRANLIYAASISVFLLLSLWDQHYAAGNILAFYKNDAGTYAVRDTVRNLESYFKENVSIYQLPYTPFLLDSDHGRLKQWDHARPYFYSHTVHWSWPSLTRRHAMWQADLLLASVPELGRDLVLSGFDGIWVDRYGYEDDGAKLEAELRAIAGPPKVVSANARYAVYDLRGLRTQLAGTMGEAAFRKASALMLDPVLLWTSGFYPVEQYGKTEWRWSDKASRLVFRNHEDSPKRLRFSVTPLLRVPQKYELLVSYGDKRDVALINNEFHELSYALELPANGSVTMEFIFNGPRVDAPGDSRSLYFALLNPRIEQLP